MSEEKSENNNENNSDVVVHDDIVDMTKPDLEVQEEVNSYPSDDKTNIKRFGVEIVSFSLWEIQKVPRKISETH